MAFGNVDIDTIGNNPKASFWVVTGVTVLSSLLAILSLVVWLKYDPTVGMAAEVPGHDGLPVGGAAKKAKLDLAGIFASFDGSPSTAPGAWTNFRGADFSNIVKDAPKLADSWGATGPKVLWKIPVGDGYASPAVLDGRVFLMDYDTKERADAIRCFSLDDGKEIWRRSYNNNIKRNHGMSRTIPAVTKEYLVVMGPKCHVLCLDTATGDFKWGIDLQAEYGTVEPLWYTGQCPIIDNGQAIIAPCGTDVLMMGVDCATGEVKWKVPNPNAWNMSHASIVPMTLLGKRMYVYAAAGGIVGVSAEPDTLGQLLWEHNVVGKVVAPSAIPVGEDQIFATVGYGRGSRLLKLVESGGKYSVEVVYDKPPTDVLACEQQTPIYHNGLIYGIMPKDAGSLMCQFVCYKPDGTLVWSSGQDNRFGLGPFILADNKFYVLGDEAELTMIDATKNEYLQLGHADILEGHDAWGPFALAGSRLLLRDMNTLACVDLAVAS
ncbi:MAG: PQQ-binding-like beta-propeller repeat protein [Candidatus Hydrogenedentes bacterium]|nr:PQQ-binding-like beta-propeller repeat protein [Candidatus Hydrogenedentota bacterium]